jgi:hypothetical protein
MDDRLEASFQRGQFAVNDPFVFESNPNDSDYRMVKRVKVETGQFGSEDDDYLFLDVEGYVRLEKNITIEFQIEPIEEKNGEETFVKFTLFILDEDEDGRVSRFFESNWMSSIGSLFYPRWYVHTYNAGPSFALLFLSLARTH